MDTALALGEAGAREFTVVQAGEQTKGRGRGGNQWSSPIGNLYMTVILRPPVPRHEMPQAAFVSALALADTITAKDLTLKWPNDVLIAGKKCAGILIEGHEDFMLIGMGVNIASGPEGTAVLGGDLTTFRDQLLQNLDHRYTQWIKEGFPKIREDWIKRMHGLNSDITIHLAENNTIEGVLTGIDEKGALIMRENGGNTRIVPAGTLRFKPSIS